MSNKIDGRFAKSVGNFKNKIINGGFDVWQRGESYTVDASDLVNHPKKYYSTADRFITSNSDTGSATLGVYTAAKEVFEDKNWFKQTCGTPFNSTDYTVRSLVTFLEAPDNVSNIKGKTVTLSFLFRAKTSGQYSVAIGDYTDVNFTIFSFNYTGGTQKCSCTFTVPNVTPDNNNSLKIYFSYGVDDTDIRISDDTNLNGVFNNSVSLTRTSDYKWWTVAGDWIAYTEIQLEEGSIATEFEQRPLSIEQMLCYRYYQTFMSYHLRTHTVDNYVNADFPVCFRATPSVLDDGKGNLRVADIYAVNTFRFILKPATVNVYWGDLFFDAEL